MSTDNCPAQTLEIVTFQLQSGSAVDAFIAASKEAEKFIVEQPGFLYRSLCQQQDSSEWLDVIYWQNDAAAQAAGKAICNAVEASAFMGMIDMATVTMRHSRIHTSLCMDEIAKEAATLI